MNLVDDARGCRHQVKVVFPLQPLGNDLQVQKPEEPAAEAEAEGSAGLRLKLERRIIQLKLFKRIPEIAIPCTVRRIDAAVNHRKRPAVARVRFGGRVLRIRHRVANPRIADILQKCREVTDHPGLQLIAGDELPRTEIADLDHLRLRLRPHHPDLHALFQPSVPDPAEDNDASVGVVQGIEDQRLERCLPVTRRRGELLNDLLQDILHIQASFSRYPRAVGTVKPDDVLDFLRGPLRVRTRQVDLVDHREDLQIVIKRKVDIAECLRFDSLRTVHYKNRSVAGGKRPGDLVVKIHMTWCIDQVEDVFLPVLRMVDRTDGLGLDRDTPLPLNVHIIQDLILHLTLRQDPRLFNDPVCERAFSVIDMRDDAEIANLIHIDFSQIDPPGSSSTRS